MSTSRTAAQQQLALELQVKRFNARFIPGHSILYIPSPGLPPEWDRLYSAARLENGAAVVELAGRRHPVPICTVSSMPIETTHVRAPQRSASAWPLVAAFVLGFACATVITISIAPAGAVSPESIVIDCAEQGDAVEEEGVA